jgi:hypothetical protein
MGVRGGAWERTFEDVIVDFGALLSPTNLTRAASRGGSSTSANTRRCAAAAARSWCRAASESFVVMMLDV